MENSQEILYRAWTDQQDANKTGVVAFENGQEVALKPAPEFDDYRGGYAWGYRGTGPQNLAHAIAWHYFRNDPEQKSKALAAWLPILDGLISMFPQSMKEWQLTRGVIEAVLSKKSQSAGA